MVLIWGYLGAFFAQARSVLWYFSEHTSPNFPRPPACIIHHSLYQALALPLESCQTLSLLGDLIHPHLLRDKKCEKIPEGNGLLLLLEYYPGLCGHVAHFPVTVWTYLAPPTLNHEHMSRLGTLRAHSS